MDLNAAVQSVNQFLDTNIGKLLLLPLGYGIFRLIGYILKRKFEGANESRDMAALHAAADLRERLDGMGMTLGQLKEFRNEVMGQSVKSAVDTAQHYIARAEYLVTDRERTEWPEANTQTEMNEQAAEQFAAAEHELTALIIERMANADADDAAAFQRAQDAWSEWRLAEAQWESQVWEGGTIRPLMVTTKMEQLTRERIAAINLSGSLEHAPDAVFIPYKKTPREIADHIEPGITGARVREILGMPHYISGPYWYYRFKETQLELYFKDEVVRDVTFAMVQGETYETTLAGFGPFAFGEMTFGALREMFPDLEIKHRTSMRTIEIYAILRLGPAGAWSDYYFGALVAHNASGKLLETEFDWDWETFALKEFPLNTLINWFGQTSDTDAPSISWFLR